MTQTGRKKLLHKRHTGKVRHHKHTSYGSLLVVLVLASIPLLSVSNAIAADESFGNYAVVAGPVPKVAPSITSVRSGQVFTTSEPVTINGSCPSDTLVKVFKNEVLAGAALCSGGRYQVPIDLFVGNNSLIARAYNANDAVSPDSEPISVQLQLPGVLFNGTDQLNTQGAPAGQFYVTSEVSHRGATVGQTMSWPIVLAGGLAPYAVSVSWGDGKVDLYSRGAAGRFDISHAYSEAAKNKGNYTIVIKTTDQNGTKSYMQLVAIVSSDAKPAGVVGSVKGGADRSAALKIGWQLLATAVVVVISFWLGEKYDQRKTRKLNRQTA